MIKHKFAVYTLVMVVDGVIDVDTYIDKQEFKEAARYFREEYDIEEDETISGDDMNEVIELVHYYEISGFMKVDIAS